MCFSCQHNCLFYCQYLTIYSAFPLWFGGAAGGQVFPSAAGAGLEYGVSLSWRVTGCLSGRIHAAGRSGRISCTGNRSAASAWCIGPWRPTNDAAAQQVAGRPDPHRSGQTTDGRLFLRTVALPFEASFWRMMNAWSVRLKTTEAGGSSEPICEGMNPPRSDEGAERGM